MKMYLLFGRGAQLALKGANGCNNGVGLLDAICEYCYSNSSLNGVKIRNFKYEDLNIYKAVGEFNINHGR